MAQYGHPNCVHPQPHCPFCDCDDCFRVAQQEVRRNVSGGSNGSIDNNSGAASVPVAPAFVAPASQPQRSQWSSWMSSPSSRYVLLAGVTAVTLGLWMASRHNHRIHHHVLYHRVPPSAMPLVSPLVPPNPAPSSLPVGMGQYEAGFLKGSEVTASMYRAMHANALDAWRSQWSNRGWCKYRS